MHYVSLEQFDTADVVGGIIVGSPMVSSHQICATQQQLRRRLLVLDSLYGRIIIGTSGYQFYPLATHAVVEYFVLLLLWWGSNKIGLACRAYCGDVICLDGVAFTSLGSVVVVFLIFQQA